VTDDGVELARRIRAGELSAREAVEHALRRAERDGLGAFWALDEDRALAGARAVDDILARGGEPGPLAGVPVAVKDGFDLAGHPTWCGVRWSPPPAPAGADAAAVAALSAAGAIPIGKTSMHQLAWGMSGVAPGFPVCRNPVDPGRMPGGSSGGSAVAVAAGIVPLALGSDSGGSVRGPAAWCGVVGFKPSLGTVPLQGCAPMSPSFDTGGVLARSVRDCASAFAALCGAPDGTAAPGRLRVGVLETLFADCDAGVERTCREAVAALGAAGADLVGVTLPAERRLLGPLYAAELAHAWGQRLDEQPGGVLDDVRASIAAGRRVLAVEYLAAQRTIGRLRAEAAAAAAGADVLVCPTSPIVAPPLGDPDPTRVAGRNTRVFNLLGWPSVSLPCGTVGQLPVGLMASAPSGCDRLLLAAAERYARELG
jgi:aspartyl-tRNA(Asn)/glutamyl-tRNA(Gln) amidotransferase subunit A